MGTHGMARCQPVAPQHMPDADACLLVCHAEREQQELFDRLQRAKQHLALPDMQGAAASSSVSSRAGAGAVKVSDAARASEALATSSLVAGKDGSGSSRSSNLQQAAARSSAALEADLCPPSSTASQGAAAAAGASTAAASQAASAARVPGGGDAHMHVHAAHGGDSAPAPGAVDSIATNRHITSNSASSTSSTSDGHRLDGAAGSSSTPGSGVCEGGGSDSAAPDGPGQDSAQQAVEAGGRGGEADVLLAVRAMYRHAARAAWDDEAFEQAMSAALALLRQSVGS
jgi:hypothetical protein